MTNRINRRQFVAQAAASATALSLAPGFLTNTVAALAGESAPLRA